MYLVFDIGGTNTRIASSSDGKTLKNSKSIPTEKDFEKQIQLIISIANELSNGSKIERAAGGVAGTLSKDKSVLINSPHLKEWIQKPLKEELETNLGTPVYLENDAHLGGLGEACFGAGKGFGIVTFITIGTGLGGARIVNQKIDRNSSGFEPGHQIIKIDGNTCNCGGVGHLETYVGGAYLGKANGIKAEEIKDQAVWDKVAEYLAIGLNNTIVHWSPEVVILSGSVAQKIPIEKVKSYLNNFLKVFPAPQIIKGSLGQEAGLYGGLKIIQSFMY